MMIEDRLDSGVLQPLQALLLFTASDKDVATDEFLYQWADAQKLAYSQGAGWIVSCGFA